MSKTAVIVLCYAAPLIIDKMLGMFDDARFSFFLHVDAKLDIEQYKSVMRHAGKAVFVADRKSIFWGGFRMIEAQLVLAEAALADPEVDNIVLISDDTAPLRRPGAIHAALREKPDRITCSLNERPRHFYDRFFYPDSKFSNLRLVKQDDRHLTQEDFLHIQRMETLRTRGKKPIEAMYFGRQWWALSRESLSAVVTRMKDDEHLTESFRYSLFPDETFFQTVFKLCFPDAESSKIPTYAEYNKRVIPWIFSSAQEIRERKFGPAHLFVRKIQPEKPDIVDTLAEAWA